MGTFAFRFSAIRILFFAVFAFLTLPFIHIEIVRADSAAFDLTGPKVEMNVTRAGKTLPISKVPNLQPGDRLWIHPDLPDEPVGALPAEWSHFCAGSTNPAARRTGSPGPKPGTEQVREEGIVADGSAGRATNASISGAGDRRRFQHAAYSRTRQARRICAGIARPESSQSGPLAAREILEPR